MNSREFAYWLQGWVELQEPVQVDELQTTCIRKHLGLVFIHDPDPSRFCSWLRGWFDIENPKSINMSQFLAITNRLEAEFEHVIDPSYPAEQQDDLNAAHAAKPVFVDGIKMGKDGVTPDSGLHFDKNSWNYAPGARC